MWYHKVKELYLPLLSFSPAKVEGKVLAQVKGEKIVIGKYKSKKNYDRKTGHRQPYTKVEITAVNA